MKHDCHKDSIIFREVLNKCAAHPEGGRINFLLISHRTSHRGLTLDMSEGKSELIFFITFCVLTLYY